MWLESLSSCAIENNRLAEILAETLHRVMTGEKVSDRYLLGLAWFLKEHEGKSPRDEEVATILTNILGYAKQKLTDDEEVGR